MHGKKKTLHLLGKKIWIKSAYVFEIIFGEPIDNVVYYCARGKIQ